MRQITMAAVLAGILGCVGVQGFGNAQGAGPASSDMEARLKAAQYREEVQGDLAGAIEEYGKLGDGSDRAVAARALLALARAYQRLGNGQAQKVYERILKQFPEQKAAVAEAARARSQVSPVASSPRGDMAVWTGDRVDLFGQVSPDGRFISYVDWRDTGNVMVHDTLTNTDRAVTQKKSWQETGEGGWSTISRDGKQIAFAWSDWDRPVPGTPQKNQPPTVRLASLEPDGRPARVAYRASEDADFLHPYDWSPDGRFIAMVSENRKDGVFKIGVLAVANGSFRVLKSVTWPGPSKVFFSADGKYIAYDLPASDTGTQRDIFVNAVDATREAAIIVHSADDRALGWSADGQRILFASDRTDSMSLWAQVVDNGRPVGSPQLLRADIGSIYPLGVTTAGALFVYKDITTVDVQIASFDLKRGMVGEPVSFERGFLPGTTVPDWSPDGTLLAYAACQGECLAVRSVETGDVRKLPTTLGYVRGPRWSQDGRSILAAGRDLRGRWGIFKVDARSGETTTIVSTGNRATGMPHWSADATRIYYQRAGEDGVRTIFERELASGTERIVKQGEGTGISPDGRLLWWPARNGTGAALRVQPIEGGEPRELFPIEAPDTLGPANWTSDGRALIVVKRVRSENQVWLVPVDGAAPRKLDGVARPLPSTFRLSHDGRRIAYLSGTQTPEVWRLENLLPAPVTKR